jgi:two-component system cell cycle sensor histidine kinase/response regulator CckA
VHIDEGHIQQVINNLVINAHQSMPGGGVLKIHASSEHLTENSENYLNAGDYVKVIFEDEGTGISKSDLRKIFDPFFSTKHDGSGLGLTTSYSVIKKHNGKIAVQSEQGMGTRFTFYLPAFPEQAVLPLASDNEAATSGEGRILVMDDEKPIRDVVLASLGMLGYEVVSSQDGHEAIEIYSQYKSSGKPFDAVILDLTIPGGMGGAEVIVQLKAIDSDVKAICASGYSNDPIMANCVEYGFDKALAKPYRMGDLSEVLADLFAG